MDTCPIGVMESKIQLISCTDTSHGEVDYLNHQALLKDSESVQA